MSLGRYRRARLWTKNEKYETIYQCRWIRTDLIKEGQDQTFIVTDDKVKRTWKIASLDTLEVDYYMLQFLGITSDLTDIV